MLAVDTDDLRDLLQEVGSAPVLSLALAVDPTDPRNHRDSGSRRWEVALRNDLHRLRAELQHDRDRLEAFDAAAAGAGRFLESYRPAGRSLLLLATGQSVIDLEVPVALRQQAGFGGPLVADFARALSEHRLYSVVLVDSETARLMVAALGYVDDIIELSVDSRWGEPGATRSGHQFRFESRREEYQQKYHRLLAEQVDRFLQEFPEVDRVVLAGNEVEAHGVARALGDRAARALVGIAAVPLSSSDAEVLARVQPLADRAEREHDRAVVAAVGEATGSGRAVFGPDAVADALTMGVAQEIVLSAHLPGDEAREELVRSALRSGADIAFVHEEAADRIDAHGGVAARLYYPAVVVPEAEQPDA